MKTTLYTVLCVAVRLGAVLMAIRIAGELPGLFFNFSSDPGPDKDFFLIGLGLRLAALLLAFALWLWPTILVRWAIARSQNQILESAISAPQLQHIALSVAGVWVFIASLGALLGRVALILMMTHDKTSSDLYAMTVPSTLWVGLVEYAVMAILGAATALGAGGLAGLFQRLRRYPGYTETKRDADASDTQDS